MLFASRYTQLMMIRWKNVWIAHFINAGLLSLLFMHLFDATEEKTWKSFVFRIGLRSPFSPTRDSMNGWKNALIDPSAHETLEWRAGEKKTRERDSRERIIDTISSRLSSSVSSFASVRCVVNFTSHRYCRDILFTLSRMR